MKSPVFQGSAVAIVTPFRDDGSVNYPLLEQLLEMQIEAQTDAIVVCGTTGESATMTDGERRDVIAYTVRTVRRRVPVIAGTGCNNTAYAVALSRFAQDVGADALLTVTPYYNKTTQKGLVRHFTAIADAVSIPVILYNVPSRTGMTVTPETYAELATHPNIVATKEASGDLNAVVRIRSLCDPQFTVYSGDDQLTVPMMAMGAMGVISVVANVCPAEMHMLCRLCLDGKFSEAAALQCRLAPLTDALFAETNPIPVKAALEMIGYGVGSCRLPLCEAAPKTLARIRAALKQVIRDDF